LCILTIQEITKYLENFAPRLTQENYDNSGLICGNPDEAVRGVILTLDCIESVVDEAISKSCNLIIAHHPIVFKGLKSFTGANYVERTIIKAIKNNIAILAMHTNLDNYRFGVNYKIGQKLNLQNIKILAPKTDNQLKIVVYVPKQHAERLRIAMNEAGAGRIGNYDYCSYSTEGKGTFRALEGANPFVGSHGKLHSENETKIEMVIRQEHLGEVLRAIKSIHPYEEVAYDLIPLSNEDPYQGAGMYGELDSPMNTSEFLTMLKEKFNCGIIKHTVLCKSEIQRVAFCGGSGSFLMQKAKQVNADIFISSDYKYHEFFDAEGQIIIADIGHYESEQFTSEIIADLLKEKNITFAIHSTETNTNPVKYF